MFTLTELCINKITTQIHLKKRHICILLELPKELKEQVFEKLKELLPGKIFVYSNGLNPEDYQPSGTINYSYG